jgi:hypothetical protein
MGTSNFQELKYILCKPFETAISVYKNRISNLNIEIARIYHLQTIDLPSKEKEKINLETQLKSLQSKLPKLDASAKNESMVEYETTNNQKIKIENELKQEYPQIKLLEQIYAEIISFNKTISDKNQYFKSELLKLHFDEKILSNFDIQYPYSSLSDISRVLDLRKKAYNTKYGNEVSPNENTYRYLIQKLNNIQQRRNEYTEKENKYLDISNKIEQTKMTLVELGNQIENIKALSITKSQNDRLGLYKQIFEEMLNEKKTLQLLYEPLINQLKKNKQEKQLGFFVKVDVDIMTWSKNGNDLIDHRRIRELHQSKNLINLAYDKLYDVWVNCDLDLITKAIDDFTNDEAKKMSRILLNPSSIVKLADWLFSTDHISISYEMTFNDVSLKQLSPGTKGVLLMLLYLGVEKNDTRPLLIDQPEDNLDPESVYEVLVPYFLEAKKRRQIIMITHNPNLVVATDSDQVIVANMRSNGVGKLPTFTYIGGGLENQEIVAKICSILEGGEDAFRKREERYFGHFRSK